MAIGVVSFAIIALLGLASVGVRVSQDSRNTQQAAELANKLLALRRAAPAAEAPGGIYDPATFPLPVAHRAADVTSFTDRDGVKVSGPGDAEAVFGVRARVVPPEENLRGVETTRIRLEVFWPPGAADQSHAQRHEVFTEILER